MPIAVACSTCGAKLRAPDGTVGRTVKCPKCGAGIKVQGMLATVSRTPPEQRALLSPNKESSSGTYPPDYPRMKRELAVVAIRQGARNLCDTANFGPSTAGRLCFALVLAALLFGVSLAISFALESAAAFAIIQGLLVFGLALTIYSTLILGETHEQLASRHAQLDQELPTAEVAWIKHKTRVARSHSSRKKNPARCQRQRQRKTARTAAN